MTQASGASRVHVAWCMARRKSAGQIVSRLLRQALTRPKAPEESAGTREPDPFYGFRPFASRGAVVTNELVDRLREEDGI